MKYTKIFFLGILSVLFLASCGQQGSQTPSSTGKHPNTSVQQEETTNLESNKQAMKQTENMLKAFAYEWYSRFDKGTSIEELRPFLPDSELEFVYPGTTLNSVDELIAYSDAAFAATKQSAHFLDEISVYQIDDSTYELITPHAYHILGADEEYRNLDFYARMKVGLGMKTEADPSGDIPKVLAYKVLLQGAPKASNQENLDVLNNGDFSITDAKAFVHNWFTYIDAGDADTLMEITSSGELGINILGNEVKDAASLKAFLLAQKDSQTYAAHTPTHIEVTKDGDGFAVSFVLNFEGDVRWVGPLKLSNVTSWKLVPEDGELKLRDYSLEIL